MISNRGAVTTPRSFLSIRSCAIVLNGNDYCYGIVIIPSVKFQQIQNYYYLV